MEAGHAVDLLSSMQIGGLSRILAEHRNHNMLRSQITSPRTTPARRRRGISSVRIPYRHFLG
jgi:hypothetical protein